MAMEVNAKQLHVHAIPVVIVLSILLVVASGLGQDLFKRVIKIHPTANGLAKITVNETGQPNLSDTPQAGRTADLLLEFQLAN